MPTEKIVYKVLRADECGARVSALPLPRGYQRTYVTPDGGRITVPTSIAFSDPGMAKLWATPGDERRFEVWRCSCIESEPLAVAFSFQVLIHHDDIGPEEMFAILSGRAVLMRRTVYADLAGDQLSLHHAGFHAEPNRIPIPRGSVVCRNLRPIHQIFSGKMTHPC